MRGLAAALAAALLAAVAAGGALAAPNGNGLQTVQATCDVGGSITATVSGGASFWIGGTHYVLTSFSGTFTPVSGPTETFTKTYGAKTGLGDETIRCRGSETFPEGTFSFVVKGVAVP